ncbi:STAS domain-containing protein [Pontiella agarivorans]|uniref:STAS domain-containing protein n=1 Tax=Pontiella agarivorans TaxID=3038953 RepID=A0ABU5MYS2_9BACT|nr:STAS domain-containing protein [Pontiella agarivorans]MDZ8119340.1 STAS domain-containing protein [Pontiella agarivorans]
MGSGTNGDNLTAAYIDHTAIVRVEGRGSFKVSPPMKQFIHQVMDQHSADRILLDMADCTGMDSTFMGVVAGLACLVKSKPEYQFKLVNLSEKNRKLLTTLGVDRVVDYTLASDTIEDCDICGKARPLEPNPADKLEAAKTTLEAHEKLVEINPENLPKFKSVLEFLEDDVRALGGK